MASMTFKSIVAAVAIAVAGLVFAAAAAAHPDSMQSRAGQSTYDQNAYVPGFASPAVANAIQSSGSTESRTADVLGLDSQSDVVDRAVARTWSWPDGYQPQAHQAPASAGPNDSGGTSGVTDALAATGLGIGIALLLGAGLAVGRRHRRVAHQ